MVSHILAKRMMPLAKQFARHSHSDCGIFGSNLPFSIKNKFFLILGFTFYTSSALTLPFYMAFYSMKKRQ